MSESARIAMGVESNPRPECTIEAPGCGLNVERDGT